MENLSIMDLALSGVKGLTRKINFTSCFHTWNVRLGKRWHGWSFLNFWFVRWRSRFVAFNILNKKDKQYLFFAQRRPLYKLNMNYQNKVDNIRKCHRKETRELVFWVLAFRQSSGSCLQIPSEETIHTDEGLKLETSVFESFTANLPYWPCGW